MHDVINQFGVECVAVGRALLQWFDTIALDALLIFAVLFRMAARRILHPNTPLIPYAFGGTFLVFYFLHQYQIVGDSFMPLLTSLIRSIFGYHVVWGAVAIAISLFYWTKGLLFNLRTAINRKLFKWRVSLSRMVTAFGQWWHRRFPKPVPAPAPLPPPPPPVPRSVVLRKQAEAAQADYDAEVAALEGLPLDDDEREALLTAAKQRLVRKLHKEG